VHSINPLTLQDDEAMQDIRNEDCNEAFFEVYSEVMQGEGSGTHVALAKDHTKPDGNACQPDGTLKDASEMEWPNSPSDLMREESGVNLKRKLSVSGAESENVKLPNAKVTHR
jgi:hypothetical protein